MTGTGSKTAWLDKHRLTAKQRVFVFAYLETLSATEAARRAAYKFPNKQGPRLLTIVGIKAAVKEGQAQIESAIQVRAEDVARKWWSIATASTTELVQIRRGACRFCYGHDHQFQWRTKRELEEARQRAAPSPPGGKQPSPAYPTGENTHRLSDIGGFGFRSSKSPNPICPECDGHGSPYIWHADIRDLSPEVVILFDGVKQTRIGVEITMLDRLKALDTLAKHLGMFSGRTGKNDADVQSFFKDLK